MTTEIDRSKFVFFPPRVNLKSSDISVSAILPILSLVSHYSIKGKLQILPIEGDGPSNITFGIAKTIMSKLFVISSNFSERFFILPPSLHSPTQEERNLRNFDPPRFGLQVRKGQLPFRAPFQRKQAIGGYC